MKGARANGIRGVLPASLAATLMTATSMMAASLPARADVNIHVNIGQTGRSPHHYDHHYDPHYNHRHRVPSVRYTYPDGRVVERYGYPHGRQEVLVLPTPVVIQQPVSPPPIVRPPVYLPQQTSTPRLLHGRRIDPITALIVGTGDMAGREGPGDVYPALTQFISGQTVTITQVAGGGDGYDWFLAASGEGQYAWIRGDRLSLYNHDLLRW